MTIAKTLRLCSKPDIVRAVSLICGGAVTELRVLNGTTRGRHYPQTMTGYFDDPQKLADSIGELRSFTGCYLIPNEVNPALLARCSNRLAKAERGSATQDTDIVRRRWLLIDLDPVRPAGISATDAEHKAAEKRAKDVYDYLVDALGWPEPVVASSGNGFHLMFRVDLPADDASLVQRCLRVLSHRFSDADVSIDESVFNPARIWKLYGTRACKGDSTADRPHRVTKLIRVPESIEVIPGDLLERLAGEIPAKPQSAARQRTNGQHRSDGTTFDLDSFISRQGLDTSGPEPWTGQQGSGRRWVLKSSPMCEHLDGAAYLIQHASGAISAGCHHDHCTWDWASLRSHLEPKTVRHAVSAESSDHAESTGEFDPFPTDILPGPVARFIHEVARSIGCDESYVVLPLLSALASAVGNTRRIRLKSSWTEPCIVWTVVIAPSGSKKSPALSLAVKALQKRQDRAFREHESAVSDYQESKAIHDVQLTDWKKRGIKHNETMPAMPERPVAVRYMTSDSTAEAMAALLSESPRGILLCRDELSAWLSSFDSYKASRGVDAPFWLELHRAGSVTVDRKTSKRVTHISRASCSITGTIQPAVLKLCIGGRSESEDDDDDREFLSNGLIARFLPASPPQQCSRWTDFEISAEAESGVERIIDRLLTLDFVPPDDPDDLGDPEPIDLSLSVDGRAAWIEFYDQHSREAAELQHDAAAAWAKLEGYAARFALLIHLLRCATDDSTLADRDLIDAHSMAVGIKITRWFGSEISRLLAQVGGKGDSPLRRERRKLVNLVQEHGGRITVRDLMRCSRRFGKTAEEVERKLDGLVKLKRGRWNTAQTAGRQKREFVLFTGAAVDGSSGNCGGTDLPSTSTAVDAVKTASEEHGESVPNNSDASFAQLPAERVDSPETSSGQLPDNFWTTPKPSIRSPNRGACD